MKFVLFVFLVFGNEDFKADLLLRGPSYETSKECEAATAEFRMQSQLPVLFAKVFCDPERIADQKKSPAY